MLLPWAPRILQNLPGCLEQAKKKLKVSKYYHVQNSMTGAVADANIMAVATYKWGQPLRTLQTTGETKQKCTNNNVSIN